VRSRAVLWATFLGVLALLAGAAVVGAVRLDFGTEPGVPAVDGMVVLETVVPSGQGAVLRHAKGAQVKILPGTFEGSTHVRVVEEELVPRPDVVSAPVWSLEAGSPSFGRPIELVLPTGVGDGETRVDERQSDTFAVYWDGQHWSRVPGVMLSDGSGLRVQATHFSLWTVGSDPETYLGNADTSPAILAVSVPESASPGEEVPVRFAVANIGPSDLDGYGQVSIAFCDRPGMVEAVSEKVAGWDGADGPFGSVVYATDSEVAAGVAGVSLVDLNALEPMAVKMPGGGAARLRIRLQFFAKDGSPVGSTTVERVVNVEGDEISASSERELSTDDLALGESVEVIRPLGQPLMLDKNGAVVEEFDDVWDFSGSAGRSIARGWGAYQSGVVALFLPDASRGLEGTAAQSIETRGASRAGIMRRVGGTVDGEKYYVAVSGFLLSSESAEPESAGQDRDMIRLGVDPRGGEDPTAAGIIWVESAVQGEWASLILPEVVAESDAMTLFLELADEGHRTGATAYFDNVEVQSRRFRELPDLVVRDIRLRQKLLGDCAYDEAVLEIEVVNEGGGRARSFNTVIGGVAGACGPWRLRGLDPGESFVFMCRLGQPGDYLVRTVVDASDSVGEANENNNWHRQDVTVYPVCPPMPTPTATSMVPEVPPTPTPAAPTPTASVCSPSAPRCLGSSVEFEYLSTDWILSLDEVSRSPDSEDDRWVDITLTGTLVRGKRHDVERLTSATGNADIGGILSLTLVDDHGHAHIAEGARVDGPLAVESRLLFEDIRDLRGSFTFVVHQFPKPSPVGSAIIEIGVPAIDGESAEPLRFVYTTDTSCCHNADGNKALGEPHFRPGVSTSNEVRLTPYLRMNVLSAELSDDGQLLKLELAVNNRDYVRLTPRIGPALVVNGDWRFGAYLGTSSQEPVGWQNASRVWEEIEQDGVPPLTDSLSEPFTVTAYALAPANVGVWESPILYLPQWDCAVRLQLSD